MSVNRLLASKGLKAMKSPHTSDWLDDIPITAVGLQKLHTTIRVAVGSLLRSTTCQPHQYIYYNQVDARGPHVLVNRKTQGHSDRQNHRFA